MTWSSRYFDSIHTAGEPLLDLTNFPKPPAWTEDALCAQADPEAFYPEKGGATRSAKKVCGRCPVAGKCLAYALEHQEQHGVWGGKSARERRRMQAAS